MKRLGVAILVALLVGGCGPKMPDTVPVSGRVTYGGGDWPREGLLSFSCKEPAKGYTVRPAVGRLAADGTFKVTSFSEGDGLVPGKYLIAVECWKTLPDRNGVGGASAVPVKYRNPETSGFVVDVDPGKSSIEINFDVPKIGDGKGP